DIHDIEDLSDDELRGLVREHLAANNMVDVDEIVVTAKDGVVCLDGRVGTDGERLVAEHVLTDLLGIREFQNNLFVDPIRRAMSPEAIDEHLVEEDRNEGLLLGDRPVPINPETETVQDDIDHDLYGTSDVGHAIADGTAWIPPESPTQEGIINDRGESAEDH
ncbi:MAG TPA: BON domain-containing protein, partial [Gemmatimonadaceae bacterium]|nr:BON domain-containing protein [Gemmatimonadaceae bacterium]